MQKTARWFLIAVNVLNGLSGLICGALFVVRPDGNLMMMEESAWMLQDFPLASIFFTDYLWIGIVMIGVLGLPGAVASSMLIRNGPGRYRWALVSAILLGLWCAAELLFMPNPLCIVYAIVAAASIAAAIYLERQTT